MHNEEIHNLYFSSNMMMIKSRTVRWTGHVACMIYTYEKCKQKFWSENLKGRDNLKIWVQTGGQY
jgi:hypothetical protein